MKALNFVKVFLDLSKVFQKAWHRATIFKAHRNQTSGKLLNLVAKLMKNRKQSLVIRGKASSCANVAAGNVAE